MEKLSINLDDLKGSRKLMDELGGSTTPFFGRNDAGETTITSITHESIVTQTYQDNGWCRENWLHYDGTREEIFTERWRRGSKSFIVTLEIEAGSVQDVVKMINNLTADSRTVSFGIKEKE